MTCEGIAGLSALFPPRLPATRGALAAPQLPGRWACSVLSWFIALQPENASLHLVSLRPPLSQLKRASSEDTLNKPGGAAASGAARLKKTSTSGAVSELAESRLRGPPGRRARGRGQVGGTQGGRTQAGCGGTGGRDPGGPFLVHLKAPRAFTPPSPSDTYGALTLSEELVQATASHNRRWDDPRKEAKRQWGALCFPRSLWLPII